MRQKHQHAAHAGEHAVHQERANPRRGGRKRRRNALGKEADALLHQIGERRARPAEGEGEHQRQHGKEDGEGEHPVGQHAVDLVGNGRLMLALAGEAGFIERLFDGGVARVHHQGQRVDAGVLFAAALHIGVDGGADAPPLRLGKLRRGLDLLVALQQLHGHPGGGRGEVLVALVLIAADVAVLRLRGVVVVALYFVAVLAVFVEVEGAVAVRAAQRGDDLLQRAAGAFVVAAHHVGDDGMLGLLVNGLEQRLEALPLLGGNGHHRRAEEARKGRAVRLDAAPLQFVHEV